MNNVGAAGHEQTLSQGKHDRTQLSPELRQYINVFKRAYLVGCGGIGAWLGFFIAASDITRELHLFDSDSVEAHNHSRFMYPSELTNEYKSISLAALIKQSRPEMRVFTYERDFIPEIDLDYIMKKHCSTVPKFAINGMHVSPLREVQDNSYAQIRKTDGPKRIWEMLFNEKYRPNYIPIIDATDNPAFQQQLCDAVRNVAEPLIDRYVSTVIDDSKLTLAAYPGVSVSRMYIPFYVRVSYNGSDHITVTTRNSSWGMEEATGRYEVIPSFALPAILASAYGVYGILQRVQELNLDIYRRVQNILWERVAETHDTEVKDTIHERVVRMRKDIITTLPWLVFKEGRLAAENVIFSPRSYKGPYDCTKVLDARLSRSEVENLLGIMFPSLYPTVSFGATEYDIGFNVGSIEEAPDEQEEKSG